MNRTWWWRTATAEIESLSVSSPDFRDLQSAITSVHV